VSPAELAGLHARAFKKARPWSEAEFAALLARPETILNGHDAGFALGRVVAGEAELLSLAVAPEARRQGLGRALLAHFEDEAATRGARRAFLEVAEDNGAARALYLAAGWRESGRRKAYYRRPDGPACDALIYEKELT